MRRLPAMELRQVCVAGMILACTLSLVTQVRAQGQQTGTLRGALQDSTNAVLPGVTLTLTSVTPCRARGQR